MLQEEVQGLHQHVHAARDDDPRTFLRLMDQDGVAIGRLRYSLPDPARAVLAKICDYHARWKDEGGPHPDFERRWQEEREAEWKRGPLGFGLDPATAARPRYTEWPELPAWNDPRVKQLRGEWLGVLEQAIAQQAEADSPDERGSPGPQEEATTRDRVGSGKNEKAQK
ncbi:MAG: hypothetical protein H6835_05340 [Planctomycetes bacterium]|nr:hypothetical protein [Planctomycetota bacterium]